MMGFFDDSVRFAVDPFKSGSAPSARGGRVSRSSEERLLQQYRTARNWRWASLAFSLVFIRFWWISLPVLVFLQDRVLGVLFFLVAAAVRYYFHSLIERGKAIKQRELGGSVDADLVARVEGSWQEVMYRAGLTQQCSPTEGVGITKAYRDQVYKQQNSISARAYGSADLYFPEISNWTSTPLGPAANVRMLRGQVADSFSKSAQMLADAWSVPSVRVVQESPSEVQLTLVVTDPLNRSLEVTLDSRPAGSPEGVAVGVTESGDPLFFPLDQANSVVGGIPGSGKSVCLNALLAGITARPDVQVIGIDCKAGVEFYDWQPRLSAFAQDQESALEVLQALDELGKRRLNSLRGSGFKSQSRKGYTVGEPMIVVIIDECAELFIAEGSSKEAKARANDLQVLVSRGVRLYRAAGISYVLATQKPTTDVIPSVIRDNCRFRLAFRCTTEEQAVAIMGSEIRGSDVSPVAIPDGSQFKGYAVLGDDAGAYTRGRGYFIEESTCQELALNTAAHRVPLDEIAIGGPSSGDLEVKS